MIKLKCDKIDLYYHRKNCSFIWLGCDTIWQKVKNGNQVRALLVQIASKPCVTAIGEAEEKQQQTKQSLAQEATYSTLCQDQGIQFKVHE